MTNHDPTEPLIDPRLEQLLGLLRKTPVRDEQKAQLGRERFLADLDSLTENKQGRSFGWLAGWFKPKQNYREVLSMKTRTKLAFTTIMVVVVLVVFLFGGAGATALAARSALPGDALYPVKTGLENTRVALAGNAYAQAQLNMRFAELRLEELNALVGEGRYGDIDQAAQQFEYHIQAALRSMNTVMAGDPALGAQLSTQINQALLRYAQALKSTWGDVPPQARPPVERMILTSEFGSESDDRQEEEEVELTGVVEAMNAGTWTVSGETIQVSGNTEIKDSIQLGDPVKIHAVKAADGSLIASEIELEIEEGIVGNDNNDDDGNENEGEIENDNDDENVNGNEDKIGNDNDDANENDDEDKIVNDNDNENVNDNDQGNGNDNDNENVNSNDDENENDDQENGNDESHDDGNENGNNNDGEHEGSGGDD